MKLSDEEVKRMPRPSWRSTDIDMHIGKASCSSCGHKFHMDEEAMMHNKKVPPFGWPRLCIGCFNRIFAKPVTRVLPRPRPQNPRLPKSGSTEIITILSEIHDSRPTFRDTSGKFVKLYYA